MFQTPKRSIFLLRHITLQSIQSVIWYTFCFLESVNMETSELNWTETQSRPSLAWHVGVFPIYPKPPSWPTLPDLTVALSNHVSGMSVSCQGLPCGSVIILRIQEMCGFDPWVRKIPWRRKWQPAPVFSPGKLHEEEPEGYSPWGQRESDATWQLNNNISCQALR